MTPQPTTKPQPHHTDAPTTHHINLPWPKPPLTANQRLHHMARARLTKQIRHDVTWLIKAARIPPVEHCTVVLYWAPGDHRERDEDNPYPTYKACCDAIAEDARIVPKDTPRHMTKHTPVILPPPHTGGMWLEITITQLGQSGDVNSLTRGAGCENQR